MKKNEILVNKFNLKYTFESGQPITFFGEYDINKNKLIYTSRITQINLRLKGSTKNAIIEFSSINGRRTRSEIIKKFRLKDNLERIYDIINTDEHMDGAIRKYNGMRVTLNDPWETTLCFVVSQFNNMKRIRSIIKNIIHSFGSPVYNKDDKLMYYTFPNAEILSEVKVKELMDCGAGFRSKYIIEAAKYYRDIINLKRMDKLKYPELKEELMSIEGIGDKVADCIALMGYGRLEAFPIDVWIKRSIERLYFKNRNLSIKEIHKFAEDRWGNFAGFAQQYVFWYGRNIIGR